MNVVPPQAAAAKVIVLYVAVHLHLTSVVSGYMTTPGAKLQATIWSQALLFWHLSRPCSSKSKLEIRGVSQKLAKLEGGGGEAHKMSGMEGEKELE